MIVARHILHALFYSTLACILGTVVLGGEFDTCNQSGHWALTFDDGPERGKTDQLLDTLAAANVKATFFVLGQLIPGNEDILKRMHSEGHDIGIHTFDHSDLATLSPDQVRNQLQQTSVLIEGATGVKPTLMRPPYGSMNDVARQVCSELGLHIVLWDVDSKDYEYAAGDDNGDTGSQEMLNHFGSLVGSLTSLENGHISLHHDIWGTTSFHGNELIKIVAENGFKFATVNQCMNGISEQPTQPGKGEPLPPKNSTEIGGSVPLPPGGHGFPRYAVGPASGSLRKTDVHANKKPVTGRCRATVPRSVS
ncbi:hypothetical protein H4R34_003915 [Dimargaris verticillata]|uniref:NodB homology domain-containing protein n=1 Tax=Dimargaris verticillata TaxID=2761393 RepID=A0A9W8B6L3_9FUNG|nr:hypothetical protein H4R34_003915 [Dimargaris verticillata]